MQYQIYISKIMAYCSHLVLKGNGLWKKLYPIFFHLGTEVKRMVAVWIALCSCRSKKSLFANTDSSPIMAVSRYSLEVRHALTRSDLVWIGPIATNVMTRIAKVEKVLQEDGSERSATGNYIDSTFIAKNCFSWMHSQTSREIRITIKKSNVLDHLRVLKKAYWGYIAPN